MLLYSTKALKPHPLTLIQTQTYFIHHPCIHNSYSSFIYHLLFIPNPSLCCHSLIFNSNPFFMSSTYTNSNPSFIHHAVILNSYIICHLFIFNSSSFSLLQHIMLKLFYDTLYSPQTIPPCLIFNSNYSFILLYIFNSNVPVVFSQGSLATRISVVL